MCVFCVCGFFDQVHAAPLNGGIGEWEMRGGTQEVGGPDDEDQRNDEEEDGRDEEEEEDRRDDKWQDQRMTDE